MFIKHCQANSQSLSLSEQRCFAAAMPLNGALEFLGCWQACQFIITEKSGLNNGFR